jgi:hypothetical protein
MTPPANHTIKIRERPRRIGEGCRKIRGTSRSVRPEVGERAEEDQRKAGGRGQMNNIGRQEEGPGYVTEGRRN